MENATQTVVNPTETASQFIGKVKRATRRRFSAEDKIRIVLEGMKREVSTAELCRVNSISPAIYYHWVRDFMEAGKARLMGDNKRQANETEVIELRRENERLKAVLGENILELTLLKKSLIVSESYGSRK